MSMFLTNRPRQLGTRNEILCTCLIIKAACAPDDQVGIIGLVTKLVSVLQCCKETWKQEESHRLAAQEALQLQELAMSQALLRVLCERTVLL